MSRIEQVHTIHNGRDNAIEWTFYDGDQLYDLSAATNIEIVIDATTTKSLSADAIAFDVSAGASGILTLKLGLCATPIDAGTYHGVKVIVYTATDTSGIVFSDGISFRVKD